MCRVQAVLSGDSLPDDLDLLDLMLRVPRPRYVTINGGGRVVVVEPEQPDPITFTSGDSFIRIPLNETLRSVEFNFRTVEPDGVILHAANPLTGKALTVETFDGKLYVVVAFGRRPAKYLLEAVESSAGRVDDGRPHRVRINLGHGSIIRLRLDDSEERMERVDGVDRPVDLGTDLYLGGVDSPDDLPWQVWSRGDGGKFYKGCLWGLRINSGPAVGLAKIVGRRSGVTAGCPEMPAGCLTADRQTPCRNGSPCLQRWAGHVCDCSETSFTGSTCGQG